MKSGVTLDLFRVEGIVPGVTAVLIEEVREGRMALEMDCRRGERGWGSRGQVVGK